MVLITWARVGQTRVIAASCRGRTKSCNRLASIRQDVPACLIARRRNAKDDAGTRPASGEVGRTQNCAANQARGNPAQFFFRRGKTGLQSADDAQTFTFSAKALVPGRCAVCRPRAAGRIDQHRFPAIAKKAQRPQEAGVLPSPTSQLSCSCDFAVLPSRVAHASRHGWSRRVAGQIHCCSGSADRSCDFADRP